MLLGCAAHPGDRRGGGGEHVYDKTRGTLAHQAPPPSPPSPCPCRPWASRSPWPRACASACAWRGRRTSSFAGAGRRCEGWAQGAEVEGGLPRDNGCASMEGSPLDGKGLGHGDHARVAALGAHHGHRCEDEARSANRRSVSDRRRDAPGDVISSTQARRRRGRASDVRSPPAPPRPLPAATREVARATPSHRCPCCPTSPRPPSCPASKTRPSRPSR